MASALSCGPFALNTSVQPEIPPDVPATRTITDYKDLRKIGAGAYGDVYSGRDPRNGDLVALKRMQLSNDPSNKEGFPITSLREIMLLFAVRDPNVVGLRDVVRGADLHRLLPHSSAVRSLCLPAVRFCVLEWVPRQDALQATFPTSPHVRKYTSS